MSLKNYRSVAGKVGIEADLGGESIDSNLYAVYLVAEGSDLEELLDDATISTEGPNGEEGPLYKLGDLPKELYDFCANLIHKKFSNAIKNDPEDFERIDLIIDPSDVYKSYRENN